MIRSNHVAEAVQLQARVDRIADGAALMTDTTLERKFIDGLADTVSCHTLENVLYQNFEELGVPRYTAEELELPTNWLRPIMEMIMSLVLEPQMILRSVNR